jgi:nucleotide-binding universal stress UspA family protein
MLMKKGAQLHLVAAYPDPQVLREKITGGATTQSTFAESRLRSSSAPNTTCVTRCRAGDLRTRRRPAEGIIKVANEQQADLIIVGSRGLTGIKRFLGSVSEKVFTTPPAAS